MTKNCNVVVKGTNSYNNKKSRDNFCSETHSEHDVCTIDSLKSKKRIYNKTHLIKVPNIDSNPLCITDVPNPLHTPHGDLCNYSHDDLMRLVTSDNFWSMYSIVDSLGDGHCFLYSLLISLHEQNMHIDKNDVIFAIKRECLSNVDHYLPFANISRAKFFVQMNDYLLRKRYDTRFGELVPIICGKALRINIVVILKKSLTYNVFVLPHENARLTALVLKTNKHYDGIKYTKQFTHTSLPSKPHAHVRDCNSKNIVLANCMKNMCDLSKSKDAQNDKVSNSHGNKNDGVRIINANVTDNSQDINTSAHLVNVNTPSTTGNNVHSAALAENTNVRKKNVDAKSEMCKRGIHKNSIKICAWNIYGLDDHKLQPEILGDFLAQNDIIMLSETWADTNTEYTFNYNFESVNVPRKFKHRLAKRSSGGLCTFIRTSLYKNGVELYKIHKDSIIWFKLDKDKFGFPSDVFLVSIYITPESSTHAVEDMFYVLQKDIAGLPGNPEIIIVGDMNSRTAELPDFNPNNFTGNDGDLSKFMPTGDNSDCEKLNILNEFQCVNRASDDKSTNNFGNQLLQMCKTTNLIIVNGRLGYDKGIGKVTCSNSRGQSTVDYVICSPGIFRYIDEFKIHSMYPESDHSPILFEIKCSERTAKHTNTAMSAWYNSYKYIWNRTSIGNLETALLDKQSGKYYSDFISSICCLEQPDAIAKNYSHYVNRAVESVFVKRKVKPASNRATWYDKECRTKRNEILSISRQSTDNSDRHVSIAIKNKEYRSIKQHKRRDFSKRCREEIEFAYKKDKSSMWKVINKFAGDKSNGLSPSPNEFFEHFQKHSCTNINDRFDYTLEKEACNYLKHMQSCPTRYIENPIENDILNRNFTEEEVCTAISKLKNNKSAGPDCIVGEFLKKCSAVFSKDLTRIYNYIIEHKNFPNMWAEGLRNPIFKAGTKTDCLNYRGITVLSVFEKVFELVTLNRLEFISEAFQKYDRYNTGFLKGSRTGDNNL